MDVVALVIKKINDPTNKLKYARDESLASHFYFTCCVEYKA